MTARVLVTGGAGFIGHHLVRSLLEDGAEVLAAFADVPPRPTGTSWRR